ncbi:hypothetical protein HJFPF1_06466 [Paramyrothecium foliicola]|nr:hypothetical protein HJFPF1_06466 [Paramyrothecium foliicola]
MLQVMQCPSVQRRRTNDEKEPNPEKVTLESSKGSRRHNPPGPLQTPSQRNCTTNMTENLATSNDAAAERAAEQARLRKERREAKIKAGGSARLNKITGMGGRVVGESTFTPPAPEPSTPAAAPPPAATTATTPSKTPSSHAADPDEVDISQHFYTPAATARNAPSPIPEPSLSEAQLRQMMLGLDRPGQAGPGFPDVGGPGGDEDPLMKMMTQMLSGGGPGGFPGMPSMPGGASPAMQQQAQRPDPYTALWRILHALVAISLGFYIAVLTPFNGTRTQREREAVAADPLAAEFEHHKRVFFWIFTTAEAVLLTTRLLLDKGRAPPSGIVYTVAGFLPEPIKGYLLVALRYWQIFGTVRSDLMACMFVLGACAWWRGGL